MDNTKLGLLLSPLLWFISLFIALILTILGNILTPRVLNWQARFSKKRAERRITKIKKEINYINHMVNNQYEVMLFFIKKSSLYFIITWLFLFMLFILTLSISSFIVPYPTIFSKIDEIIGISPQMNENVNIFLCYFAIISTLIFFYISFIIFTKLYKVVEKISNYSEFKNKKEKIIKELESIAIKEENKNT